MNHTPTTLLGQQKLTARVLVGRAFLIKTPVCAKLYMHIERWLTCGMLGAVVYGRPRLGKTSAARWALSALSKVLVPVSWIEVPVRRQHLDNEGAFFQFLLQCTRSRYYNKGTVANKRDRFTEALATRARRSPIKTVILFFDEAQLLTELHYHWLINISNELEQRGLRLFCLLVGQHQLVSRKDTFIAEGLEEIVGRFMIEGWAFPGIQTFAEFEGCLKEYSGVVYPEEGGQPFAAYYVPLAVDRGWQLESVAPPLWDQFLKKWSCAGREGNPIIPMHYFSSALINLLNRLSKIDDAALVIPEKMYVKAVAQSGYESSIITLGTNKAGTDYASR